MRPLKSHHERGGALLIATIAVVLLSGMSAAILSLTHASKKEHSFAVDSVKAFYSAEAGISDAFAQLSTIVSNSTMTQLANLTLPVIGSKANPIAFGGGGYFVGFVDNLDGTVTARSTGAEGLATRTIEVVFQVTPQGVFSNAIFAGNRSGDPAYELSFGGMGSQADYVDGNIYSGQDIDVGAEATVTGTGRANGSIQGLAGIEGLRLPNPDIAGMNYASNHDINVSAAFVGAAIVSDDAGGSAGQLPETDPAHIFRKNPNDRASEIASTVKDDYFLEDPYEPVNIDPSQDGSDPFPITISGAGSAPGPDGNNKVYYIDGNLWVHNNKSYSFQFQSDGPEPRRIVFVVKGNIYYSDNLFYQDPDQDAVAFIAIEDATVHDSGNIYFGDPAFGTLNYMDAFMYAENNFYDTNLDAAGSATVHVNGNMTAGNHVAIQRDFNGQHSKLTVTFDDRIWTGQVTLPGLPLDSGAGGAVESVSWKEVVSP